MQLVLHHASQPPANRTDRARRRAQRRDPGVLHEIVRVDLVPDQVAGEPSDKTLVAEERGDRGCGCHTLLDTAAAWSVASSYDILP